MTPTHRITATSTANTSIPTTSALLSGPVLGPRNLAIDLFARALDGGLDAEDDLRELAAFDAVADAAHEALVLVDLERDERTAAGDFPPVPGGLLDRILAAIHDVQHHDVHRHLDATTAMRRPMAADLASCLSDELGDRSPWRGCGQPAASDRWGGSSDAMPCRRGDH